MRINITLLKEILEEKKINQKKLSELSGVSKASLCRYLKGDIEPRMDVVMNISKALGVMPECLLGEKELEKGNPFKELESVVARSRAQLTPEEKQEIIKLLLS